MSNPALVPEAVNNNIPQPIVEGHSSRKDGDEQQISRITEVSSSPTANVISGLEGLKPQKGRKRIRQGALFHCNQIKYSINQGVDVNTLNHDGVAALIIVTKAYIRFLHPADAKAVQQCLEIIRELLDRGANLNVQDRDGRTALILAIEAQRPPMVGTVDGMDVVLINLLIERGAPLDPPSQCDRPWPITPLIAAIFSKRLETQKLLLLKKANANTCVGSLNGMYAAIRDGEELFPERLSPTVSTLLYYGADIKSDEQRILATAISRTPESVERFLHECYDGLKPELYSRKRLELSEEKSSEVSASTSSSPTSALGAKRLGIKERLKEVYRTLVEKQKDAGSLMKSSGLLSQSIQSREARVEELCSSCRSFEKDAKRRVWFFHSHNSESLYQSISGGCAMCQLIKDCLPDRFGMVLLYYYSALSESDTLSQNYYERIIVRGQVPDNTIYGELRLATIDENTASTLARVRRFDDLETNSEPAFQLVSHWMGRCLDDHGSACLAVPDKLPTLPTRVIDVGAVDGSKDPYLFISKGKQANYTTLSYCWGERANLCTESSTLESFTKSIPFRRIPKTIQEAIITTRRLGIRYIWVDTLCILQDSVEDWLREAKNIASVYRNCILTIAAADSVDSEGGLFRKRRRSRTRPVQIAPRIAPFSSSTESVFAFGDRQESNDGFRCESRLDKRGWVLQEQLLSPRTLNFSSQELYWECPSLLASESYPAGIPKDHDHGFERRYFMELKTKIAGKDLLPDKDRVHMLWQHLVVLYCKRELSRETDKLVALAGAATQVSRALDDKFVAGMWIKFLWRDLLWWVDGNISTTTPPSARPKVFKAPSWSWASIQGPVSYRFPQGTSYLRYYPCLQVLSHGEKVHIHSNKVSGFITIRAVILPATIPDAPTYFPNAAGKAGPVRTSIQLQTAWLNKDSVQAPHPPIWKPDTEEVISEEIQCLIVAASHQYIVCLGLVPTKQRPYEYRRVGLTYWSPYYHPIPDKVEFQVITIV